MLQTKHFLPFLITAFLIYSVILIWRSSFIVEGVRYFSLFEDMMISMKYAKNLAGGEGLVWNAGGERIEGLTNPAWILVMAIVHLFPIPAPKISLVVQLISAGLLAINLIFVARIARLIDPKSFKLLALATLLTATYFPLTNWGTVLGTEVALLTLLTTWGMYLLLRQTKTRSFNWLFFMLLGFGTCVRLDFALTAGVLIAGLIWLNPKQLGPILTKGVPIFLSWLIAQFALRWWYYREFLPNTYYLKMTGYPVWMRVTRGLYVGLRSFNWLLMSLPFAYVFITKKKSFVVMLALLVVQWLYSVYVGGDAWEYFSGANRYLAVAMPLFFIALAQTLIWLQEIIASQLRTRKARRHLNLVSLATMMLIILIFNTASDNTLLESLLLKPPRTVGENRAQVLMALRLNERVQPDTTIGITWAGITPYFSQGYFIDVMGKNEKVIARQPAHLPPASLGPLQKLLYFWPGHLKWDYDYVLSELKPDVFAQVYPPEFEAQVLQSYDKRMTPDGYVFYFKKAQD